MTIIQYTRVSRIAAGIMFCSAGFVTALLLCLASVTFSPAHALEEDELLSKIEGFPAKAHYCQIMVIQPGAMSASFTGNKLSSKLPGGHPGFANITATRSSYNVVVDAPAVFTSMPCTGD